MLSENSAFLISNL